MHLHIFPSNTIVWVSVCVWCVCECRRKSVTVFVWRSWDSSVELVLPFQLYVGSGVSVRLSVSGGRCFYLLGHTDCSETSFSFIFFLDRLTIFFLICICMFVCGYAHGSAGTFRGQRMLSPLVLELDSCESPDTGAGNWTLGFLSHWIFSLAHLSVLFRRASVHRICLAFLHVSREVWKRPLSNHPGLTAWFIDPWDCTSIFLLESSVVGLVLSSLVSGGEKPSLPARRCKVLTLIALAW